MDEWHRSSNEHRVSQSNFTYNIDKIACEGCGVCTYFCPADAIAFEEEVNGEFYVSRTRFGPMVHARLGIAAENSGKLVTLVRERARGIALERGIPLVLIDGPPGIGCPVIASITGASLVLVVTEPTLSGKHDLERVLKLAGHFGIPAAVCVNKWDLNPTAADEIEERAISSHATVVGRIRLDQSVTSAQVHGVSVVEFGDCPAAQDIRRGWDEVCRLIALSKSGTEFPTTSAR